MQYSIVVLLLCVAACSALDLTRLLRALEAGEKKHHHVTYTRHYKPVSTSCILYHICTELSLGHRSRVVQENV